MQQSSSLGIVLVAALGCASTSSALPQDGMPSGLDTEWRWPEDAPVKHGVLVRKGKHYTLHVQFDGKRAAARAIHAIEATWPIAMEVLGDPDNDPDYPLQVHLYDDKTQYNRVDQWLTGGNFKFNESFSHWNSLTSHVVMAPPLGPIASREFGLSSQTLEVLVHEAAHLATYTVYPTYRWHPTWFSEGLVMWIEQEVLRELGLLESIADHPRYSTQELQAKRLLDSGRMPKVTDLLKDQLPGLDFHERYALWNEFFRVLRDGGERRFRLLMSDLRDLRGGASLRNQFANLVLERYGEEYLERGLKRAMADAPAAWIEDYRSLETIGDEWEQVAFPTDDAQAWRTQPVGVASYSLSGALVLFDETDRLSVLLDREETSYLSVDFEHGFVSVRRHRVEADEPEVLARERSRRMVAAEEMHFDVRVEGAELRVLVDGEETLTTNLDSDALGPWGLGARRGGGGLWRGVRLNSR